MATSLSEGSLEAILSGGEPKKPVIQILGIKKVANNSPTERYRLQVSDGKCSHSFALIATQWNEKIVKGELPDYTIIRIENYITTSVSEMRVMVIMDLSIITLGTELGMKIGNPMSWQELNAARSQNPPAARPAVAPVRATPAPRPSHNVSMNSISSSQLSTQRVHPIAALSPYQNTWVIKARIMNKPPIRTWSNARGEGKLFSMDLCDESGEIRATAFKDQCDKFYDMIEVDKVYYISRCTLKPANKQYSTLNNDYEMTFTNDTMVEECLDSMSVPSIQYNFIPISEISDKSPDSIIDLIGVCKTYSDVTELVARNTGKQLKKRELGLVDESGCSVSLTLWGTEAEQFDGSQRPVVAIRGARVSEFNGGKSLSVLNSTVFKTNPDIVEAHKLRGWFDNGGSEQQSINMSARTNGGVGVSSEWLTFADVEARQLGSAERGDYFSVLGCLTHINTENAIYKACPLEQCNKKLIDQENGLYRCEKCDKEFPNYKYRLIMSGFLTDNTGSQWVTLFNESAETILGKSANDIGHAFENDKKAYISMFEQITFKEFLFKIRIKLENFGDETRLKFTALNAQPADYKETNSRIIKQILELTGIQLK